MAGRVLLHVGAMKSGTSYLQSRLYANRERLLDRGIRLPGATWASQVRAVQDVVRTGELEWPALAQEVREHPGTSVISMEFLGSVRPLVAERVRDSLTGPDGADAMTVVVTARDLNRSVVAMWQETLQNGRSWSFEDYLAGVKEWRPGQREPGTTAPGAGQNFWRQQNLGHIAKVWARAVGPENVVVVTVPPPGAPPEVLWQRFCEVLGTDPDGTVQAARRNESLGAASARALGRLNELLDEAGFPYPHEKGLRKSLLAKQVMAGRRSAEPSIGLPVAPWVEGQADRMVRVLQRSGVRLVGDWADLEPVEVPGVDPATIPDGDVAEAALAGLAGLIARGPGLAGSRTQDAPEDADDPSPSGDEVGHDGA